VILSPTATIKPGMVAYNLENNVINDSMRLVKGGGYIGAPVKRLMEDGWTFVCSNNQFKKGNKIKSKDAKEIAVALRQYNDMVRPKVIKIEVDNRGKITGRSELSLLDTIFVLNAMAADAARRLLEKKSVK